MLCEIIDIDKNFIELTTSPSERRIILQILFHARNRAFVQDDFFIENFIEFHSTFSRQGITQINWPCPSLLRLGLLDASIRRLSQFRRFCSALMA